MGSVENFAMSYLTQKSRQKTSASEKSVAERGLNVKEVTEQTW